MWFMEESKGLRKYGNYILAFAVMAVNVIVMAVCFDFYYDRYYVGSLQRYA